MADEADRADENIERQIQSALSKVRQNRGLIPTGLCYYCQEPVRPSALFCDGEDCRNDFDYEQKLRQRNGT
jgi:predicted nucleic acid-binding Zn ribbon protein